MRVEFSKALTCRRGSGTLALLTILALPGCVAATVASTAIGVAATAVDATVDVAAGAADLAIPDDEEED